MSFQKHIIREFENNLLGKIGLAKKFESFFFQIRLLYYSTTLANVTNKTVSALQYLERHSVEKRTPLRTPAFFSYAAIFCPLRLMTIVFEHNSKIILIITPGINTFPEPW